jgi:hypothetical protein
MYIIYNNLFTYYCSYIFASRVDFESYAYCMCMQINRNYDANHTYSRVCIPRQSHTYARVCIPRQSHLCTCMHTLTPITHLRMCMHTRGQPAGCFLLLLRPCASTRQGKDIPHHHAGDRHTKTHLHTHAHTHTHTLSLSHTHTRIPSVKVNHP